MRPQIPTEEYVCDVFALYHLFEMVFEHYQSYRTAQIVDSYFVSVLNIGLVNSSNRDDVLISETEFVYACTRAINTIRVLVELWIADGKEAELLGSIQTAMLYTYQRYRNLLETLDDEWTQLRAKYSSGTTNNISLDEEETLIEDLVMQLSAIQ